MNWVWTWGGRCFGYMDGDDLWTHDGRHVGRVSKDREGEIYGPNGRYLGEIRNDNRLITNVSKKSWAGFGFAPYGRRAGFAKYADYAGYAMYAGHEEFPAPEDIR